MRSETTKALRNTSRMSAFLRSATASESNLQLLKKFNELMSTMDISTAAGTSSQSGFPRLDNKNKHTKRQRTFPKPPAKRGKSVKSGKSQTLPILFDICAEAVAQPINDTV